jgi:hypothetical protein
LLDVLKAGAVEPLAGPQGVARHPELQPGGRDREIQQIVLTDAPAVLGWERFRQLDEQNVLGEFRAVLAAAAQSGRLDPRHVDVFAHLMMAAVNETAMLIARSADPVAALPAAEAGFDEFLRRLLG